MPAIAVVRARADTCRARALSLHHSGVLQHQPQPVVGDLDLVLLGDLLVKCRTEKSAHASRLSRISNSTVPALFRLRRGRPPR